MIDSLEPLRWRFAYALLVPLILPCGMLHADDATAPRFAVRAEPVFKQLTPKFCWFHPRVAPLPGYGKDGQPAVIMTIQKHLAADDHYSGLYFLRTDDLGKTWSGPTEIAELAWQRGENNETIAVCDVTPGWHAKSSKLIAIGIKLRYSPQGAQLLDKPRSHECAYATYDPKADKWTSWQMLAMPETDGKFFLAAPGCVQWLEKADGTLLVPIYFKGRSGSDYQVTVLHCGFDGQKMTYLKHGDELAIKGGRGLCEPSLAHFDGTYFLTLRNDARAYVTSSKDGLHFEPVKPWTFDDGKDLGSYNTQAHWLVHSEGLFLSYTRRGANNDHIARNRAPIFVAQVDPVKLQVIRKTEQALLPERGVMLGNFGATAITADESWVTDAEFIVNGKPHPRGADGTVWLGRVQWAKPNRSVSAERKQGSTWKAGIAKAVITPEKAVWLAGYGTKRPPEGKLHDLWAKALALEDPSGNRVVLVTSDFQGIPKEMSDRVFERLQKELGLERRQVMLTFSHNHCGPRLGTDLQDYYPVEPEQVKLVEEYTGLMESKLLALVGEALSKLGPADLKIGQGRATFAVNRRNNREADVPVLLAKGEPLKGPVDHGVPVMTVTGPDQSLVAIVFGYACHPTTLSFNKWCGDYPGFAQLALEKKHPGTTAMFVNTCGGDQNPLPRRKVELCERYGHMLADAVEQAIRQPLKPVTPGLRTAFEYVDLPYEKVIAREELQAAIGDSNAIRKRWAERLLGKLDAGEKFASSYPYPVHAWRLGSEMLVIGMGAETVVDYALRFKAEFGAGTWVCGYADDMIAYIPSRRVWVEGGYEGGPNLYEYGRPALRWQGDIEDRIASCVHKLTKRVAVTR